MASNESPSFSRYSSKVDPAIVYQQVTPQTRANIWSTCLKIPTNSKFNERVDDEKMDDVPNLALIVEYANMIVDEMELAEYEKPSYKSEIIRLISYHSVKTGITFEPINGWHNLLEPLVTLNASEMTKYNLFKSILNNYIPCKGDYVAILRLLLLYHDPQLCNFFSSKDILLNQYPSAWINRLFTGFCSLPVVLKIWDRYFTEHNQFLIFFLSVALIIKSRDTILELANFDNTIDVFTVLWTLPSYLTTEDIYDLFLLADDLKIKTPVSYLKQILPMLFGDKELDDSLFDVLCWPVTIQELMSTIQKPTVFAAISKNIRFFIIDCRSIDEFNAGHLSVALSLDPNLKITNVIKYEDGIQQLLKLQQASETMGPGSRNKHFCILDSGRDDDKKYTKLVIKMCLQRNIKYVTRLLGGYAALHHKVELDNNIDNIIINHNRDRCRVCLSSKKSDELKNPLRKLKKDGEAFVNRLKLSTSVYDMEYSVATTSRMTKSKSMYEKPFKVVSITKWLEDPHLEKYFECQERDNITAEFHKCHLLVTKDYLIALREIPDQEDAAHRTVKQHLLNIEKIVTTKNNKNLVTFIYEKNEQLNDFAIVDRNSFLFDNAIEPVQFISDKIREKSMFNI